MGKTRSELRDAAVNIIYQTYIFDQAKIKYDINELIKEKIEIQNDFVFLLVDGVIKNQKDLSSLANKYLVDWSIDRLSKVDKAILSVAVFELLHTETPKIVAINEAIELSHKYSDPKVTNMINACLDKIYHEEIEENA